MMGEKVKPLVIGKSKSPRAFKNGMPGNVTWKSNSKAWMTAAIFGDWLEELNSSMRKRKRRILLFVDNCAAHNVNEEYTNVKVKFLPANTTSLIQPLDQGIIRHFKVLYRRRILEHIVSACENAKSLSDVVRSVNFAHACSWISSSWSDVEELIIRRCFRKGGFVTDVDI
jgi:hypothetical protein